MLKNDPSHSFVLLPYLLYKREWTKVREGRGGCNADKDRCKAIDKLTATLLNVCQNR